MKNTLKLLSLSIIISLLSTSCNKTTKNNSDNKINNVILLIGDGMSIPQINAFMLTTDFPTSFERFPATALAKTNSKSNKITDSAAGGTAIATGNKTNNGMIGMNADSIAVSSILEIMSDKGKKTGVVATSYVTHATPASFVAKNINRNNYEEIAMDFAQSDKIDIIIGGGRKHFINRKDSLNLINEMINNGWYYYDSISHADINNDKIIVLQSEDHLDAYPQRGEFLSDATSLALKSLSNNNGNGFFLMIEGSQIDFAGHNNDSTYLINEMRDFNDVINIVLDFAENNKNTLVVVTADHETGGLTMTDPEERYTKTNFNFSTGSHSPLMVPVFAYGPGSEEFSGIIENTDIMKIILDITE